MAQASDDYRQESVDVEGTELAVVKGGSGTPLLILHEELGHPGWLKWHSAVALDRTLIIPLHPGFGVTPRAEWISNVRDLAGFYARFVRDQKLEPVDVVGFSLGGWIAAEMAACNPEQFRRMVLVAPMGIRPPEGELLDFFHMMAPRQLIATVLDPENTPEFDDLYGGMGPEQFELWEDARAETARLAWTPFLHNPSLPHLLGLAEKLPTLLIYGREDSFVPLSAVRVYKEVIPGSKLVIFDKCGHRPEVEKRAEFVNELRSFID
jgi:pimeloyl-ACP methyl ester carboxylesterase